MSVLNQRVFRSVHRVNAIILTVFIVMHLSVNLTAWAGPEMHSDWQAMTRLVYRNVLVELLLIGAIVVQAITGIIFASKRKRLDWTVISGLYLAVFMTVHASAALSARLFYDLDTDYFWAAGSLSYGILAVLFAIYYALAVISLFVHLQAAFAKGWPKRGRIFRRRPRSSAVAGLAFAIILLLPFSPILRSEPIPEATRAYFEANFGWTGQIPPQPDKPSLLRSFRSD